MTLPSDHLRVFISSTLAECKRERECARDAVKSLNHDPILFEDFGGRPHAPRTMYVRGIQESNIFVAIYRDTYGWVAPNMEISGIEDEYRIAVSLGLPLILFVFADGSKRNNRLTTLIEEIEGSGRVTVGRYANTDEIYSRLRDSISGTLAERFHATAGQPSLAPQSPRAVLTQILLPQKPYVARPAVEAALRGLVEDKQSIRVFGPLGCGKTSLLAAVAAAETWPFVDARSLSRKDVFAQAANALRLALGHPPMPFGSAEAAVADLASGWTTQRNVVLVVDGLHDDGFLREWIPPREANCLITGVRSAEAPSGAGHNFRVPALGRDEVGEHVRVIRGTPALAEELDELMRRSGGNPLYVRFYTQGAGGAFADHVQAYELRAYRELDPVAREALTYLALASRPLSLEDLSQLVLNDGSSIESMAEIMDRSRHLWSGVSGFYRIFHEHFQETVRTALSADAQRHAVYASRLGQHLQKIGDFVNCFFVLDRAGHPSAADVVDAASLQAVTRWDVPTAKAILARRLEFASDERDSARQVESLLALSHFLFVSSSKDESETAIDRAEQIARTCNEPDWKLRVREVRLRHEFETAASPEALEQLLEIQRAYQDAGDEFNAARLGIDLSQAHLRLSNTLAAIEQAERAFETLSRLGDDYGSRLARFNLASALTGTPGRREEGEELFATIEAETRDTMTDRERLFFANFNTRRNRERGDLEAARAAGELAMDLAIQLGDTSLIVQSTINLGNVLRDQGDLDGASAHYRRADRTANAGHLPLQEAMANDLIATLHNRRNEFPLALHHATYGLALLGGLEGIRAASLLEEKAIAHRGMRDWAESADAYLQAAVSLKRAGEDSAFRFRLLLNALGTFARHTQAPAYIALRRFMDENLELAPEENTLEQVRWLAGALPEVLADAPLEYGGRVLALCVRDLMHDAPPQVRLELVKALINASRLSDCDVHKKLSCVACLVPLLDAQKLSMMDVFAIGELVSDVDPSLSFKAYDDGAVHWNLSLKWAQGVACTVKQLDDRTDIALAASSLAIQLKSIEHLVQRDLVSANRLPRDEVQLVIGNFSEVAQQIDPEYLKRAGCEIPLRNVCAIGRPAELTGEAQMILILCRDDFWDRAPITWEGGPPSSLEVLCRVLPETVLYLSQGSTDLESLAPKAAALANYLVA